MGRKTAVLSRHMARGGQRVDVARRKPGGSVANGANGGVALCWGRGLVVLVCSLSKWRCLPGASTALSLVRKHQEAQAIRPCVWVGLGRSSRFAVWTIP